MEMDNLIRQRRIPYLFHTLPDDEGHVTRLASSQVNYSINKIWKRGRVTEKKVSATIFRKAATTHVRDQRPDLKDDMAQLCCHSTETADRFYRLYDHQQKATETAKVVEEVMTGGQKQIKDSVHWPKSSPVDNEIEHYVAEIAEVQEKNDDDYDSDKTIDCYNDDGQLPPDSPLNAANLIDWVEEEQTIIQSTHKRRSFTPEESHILITLCENNIVNEHMYKNEIRQTLTATAEGRNFVEDMKNKFGECDMWKKITDRVRTESRQRKK